MNRYVCLILLGGSLLLGGCAESDAREGVPEVNVRALALEARIDTLEQQKAQLEEEARMQHTFLEAYTRLINRTLADLDAITAREGMLRQIRLDLEADEADSRAEGEGMGTIEERIQENLVAIQRYMEESEKQRDELKRQHDELRRIARMPSVDTSGLEETIQKLNTLIEEKEQTILMLREEAERMLGRIDELKEANTELVEENTELRQAFYVVGTQKELAERGVIDLKRGFLRIIGRKTRIGELDARYFQTIDVDTDEIFVGQGLKQYQLLSEHKQQEALFTFEERGEEVFLSILDPEAFWKISRYLIVEVKR